MDKEDTIEIILSRTYTFTVEELKQLAIEEDYDEESIDKDLLIEKAKKEAMGIFSGELMYFEDNVDDFVGATARVNCVEEEKYLASIDDECYVLVPWPYSQEYMEEEWFYKEAVLAVEDDEKEIYGSAYFIPLHRIKN